MIGDEGVKALANALSKNCTLVSLNLGTLPSADELGWNDIREEGAQALAKGLAQNRTLAELDIGSFFPIHCTT